MPRSSTQPPVTPRSSTQPPVMLRSSTQPPDICRAPAQPPVTPRSSVKPFVIQYHSQLHQQSSHPSPVSITHSGCTARLVAHQPFPSQPSTNQPRYTARAQCHMKQTHPSPHSGPVAHCLRPNTTCAGKLKCTTVTPPRNPPTCALKKASTCLPPAQPTEYVHLPEGRVLKVYQRKDGSKFYNDHRRRQDIQPHHIVKSAPFTLSTSPIKQTSCQPSAQASEYVHLPEGRTLKVYQRKDGSKFYNDHGRRQTIQPHHTVNYSSAKQAVAPTRCTPCKPAASNTPTEYVHLAGGRKLKVYQRKDGSKYYNDHGRRKNL